LTELGPENQNWRYAVSSHMSEVTSTDFVIITTSSIVLVPVPAVARRCCVVQ
jgi:hypothetical protein